METHLNTASLAPNGAFCSVGSVLFLKYQFIKILRSAEHTFNYDLISDSWFDGKTYVQLIGQKRSEYVMVLCNPCRCKHFLNGKRFSLIFKLLRRFIGEDSNFQS